MLSLFLIRKEVNKAVTKCRAQTTTCHASVPVVLLFTLITHSLCLYTIVVCMYCVVVYSLVSLYALCCCLLPCITVCIVLLFTPLYHCMHCVVVYSLVSL